MLAGLIDLASELVGGRALATNDDFFAPMDNLLKAGAPVFVPDKFTDRGKWMDGWESRRKRTAGHDWCIVALGIPGVLGAVDIDTSHFLGNFPSHASLDFARVTGDVARVAGQPEETDWKPALDKVLLQGGGHNLFAISAGPATHVRLNIFPDGGVARLRVYGAATPDFEKLATAGEPVDVASVVNGGLVLASSDEFFGSRQNLIMPGRPANMGGGWETRRRRGPGYDWIVIRLGTRAGIHRFSVETEHYKGNFPDACSIDAADAVGALTEDLVTGRVRWTEVVPASKLTPDAVRVFDTPPADATHVRLNIYPDGGISRLRVFGRL